MSISAYEFLLRELRIAREAADLTQQALGSRIHFSAQKVSAVETGRAPLTDELVSLLDQALDAGGRFVRFWADLVKDGQAPAWLREWLEFEREAVVLRSFESTVVPGLLQTEHYARALLSCGWKSPEWVEQQVAARMDRQAILGRDDPPHLIAIIDEQALRRPVGGAEVMREQLTRLADLGTTPNVRVHIVPTSVPAYAGLSGPFALATLAPGTDVAFLDNQLTGQVVERPDDVLWLHQVWESVRSVALDHEQSLKLITEMAQTWT